MTSQHQQGDPRLQPKGLLRKFMRAREGNLAIMTALMAAPLIAFSSVAIDYGLALKAQSRLEQAAQIAAASATNAARRVINSYASHSTPATPDHDSEAIMEGQTTGIYAYTSQADTVPNVTAKTFSVSVARNSNTISATVSYTAQVPTLLMKMAGIPMISISGSGANIVGVMDEPANNASANPAAGTDLIINDSWNATTSSTSGNASTAVYNNWYSGTPTTNSGLLSSTDAALQNAPAAVTGGIRVGDPANSIPRIISKKIYLAAGDYVLRYWYRSTVVYPEYEPIYICGSVEQEMSWVASGRTRTLASTVGSTPTAQSTGTMQTARAGVYLTPIIDNPRTDTAAPTLSSFAQPPAMTGSTTPPALGGMAPLNNARTDNSANRIDICAYSSRWIQRNVPIHVKSAGYFWLNFVAEVPTSTTTLNGYYLGPVKVCPNACSDASYNNFPWAGYNTSTNTPGVQFFSDSFDATAKNDGDPFDLTSGTISTSAGYEMPINNWMIGLHNFSNNIINSGSVTTTTTDFLYGVKGPGRPDAGDGTQYVKANVASRNLTRRLLLLPGFYRLRLYEGNQPTTDSCHGDFSNSYYMDVSRQDLYYSQNSTTASPPSFSFIVKGGSMPSVGCSPMSNSTICYLLAGTQYYDFNLGVNTVAVSTYVDSKGVTQERRATYDAIKIDFLAPYQGGSFPNPGGACTIGGSPSRQGVGGGAMFPGYTIRDFGRFSITAPLP